MANYTSYISYLKTNVENKVPSKGGVYKIGKEKANDPSKVTVVYVGKSDDLRRRLLEHLSDNETNTCLKSKVKSGNLWISWTEISTESARSSEETDRIHHFSPECNIQQKK